MRGDVRDALKDFEPGGTGPIVPIILIGIGGYLAWFGVRYWRSQSVIWPSDPIKAVLQGKPLPATTAAPSTTATLTAYETSLQQVSQQQAAAGQGSLGPVSGPPSNATQAMVIRAVLAALKAPQTSANINSMASWQGHEAPWNGSPPDGAAFTHNPWNTTLAAGSTGSVNSVGVRIYPDWATGIRDTVETLLGGYPSIVAALRSGRGLCGSGLAGDFSKWSSGGYSSVC